MDKDTTNINQTPNSEPSPLNPPNEESDEEQPSFAVEKNSKLAKTIYCKFCHSKILKPTFATLVQKKIWLHFDQKSEDLGAQKGETLQWFWLVKDMMDFENIGFSKDLDGTYKYLTCADCERPCLGIQFLSAEEKNNIYVTSNSKRVTYE